MSEQLITAIIEMREEDALKITDELLEGGTAPLEILDSCRKAMDVVGDRFEEGTYFISDLILAGEMLTHSEVLTLLKTPEWAEGPDPA